MIRTAHRLLSPLLPIVLALGLVAPVAAVGGPTYVELTNEKRASEGRGPVSFHEAVDRVAAERARQMAERDAFEHDLAYVDRRLKALGVCFTGYGEIIAYTTAAEYGPADAIRRWWASDGHHAIMVGDYTHASGSHKRSDATGRMYSVMIFARLCSGGGGGDDGGSRTDIRRLAGGDRYETAARISRSRFADASAPTVFVATGASFPDALSGAPAAAQAGGPILLTDRSTLPRPTIEEIRRLRPGRIVVLGGPGVVSHAVAARLGSFAPVERWAGANRFATSATISARTFGPGVPVVYLATGDTFPDALSGGAVAGRLGGPILLVERDLLPKSTAAELRRLAPGRIVLLGGHGVIGERVAAAAGRLTAGSVGRLAGADRYGTSVQISRSAYRTSDAVFVATGTNFPDGLAGGPVAALLPGPLLLVEPGELPGVVRQELRNLAPDRVFVLGGPGVVSGRVVEAIDAALP